MLKLQAFRRVLHTKRESGEMADTLDLGSSALGVRVQVPPLAISACGKWQFGEIRCEFLRFLRSENAGLAGKQNSLQEVSPTAKILRK